MNKNTNRRSFMKTTTLFGSGLALLGSAATGTSWGRNQAAGLRVGLIGLDTSHCIAFAKTLNNPEAGDTYGGYKVVAAYPGKGSPDIKSSIERIDGFTNQIKEMGIRIVDSIETLLNQVDVVMLETVDGRCHLEQALPVLKAGKRMFIDKPAAASLSDAMAIFDAARFYDIPVFSASSLRYITGMQDIKNGVIGKVQGADTYSPATIEPSHPDLFWYGIHGVETLFAAMGTGCKSVTSITEVNTDIVVGRWEDGRLGVFRGIRSGKGDFGGTVFGEKAIKTLGTYDGYVPLLAEIIRYFKTGVIPVTPDETLEILAFMEAADESKKGGGIPVSLEMIMQSAREKEKSHQ
jgi:uncharacterized protein with GYD domain